MIAVVITIACVVLLAYESYKYGVEEGRTQGFDEAIAIFEEETRKCQKS